VTSAFSAGPALKYLAVSMEACLPTRKRFPVLVVQMPSDPLVARFYTALLAATGAPLRPRQRLAELEQLALRLLRQLHVRMLVIDELHHVLAGRGDNRREFLNLVRFLGNEPRIPRLVLRLILGVIIAVPVIMGIFRKDINAVTG
jgi:hypothetical protein